MGHSARDLDDALFLTSFDDCPNVQIWPDLQARSSNSPNLLDLLAKCSADAARIGAPAVCYHQQRSQTGCTSTNLRQQAVGQATITRELDHPTQPQARRNHHGQAHPSNHLASFHPNFISLNMHQIQFPLLDHLLMHLLALFSCSISPLGYCALIKPEGMDNGLDRTPIRKKRHHDHNQFPWLAQALQQSLLVWTTRRVWRLYTRTLLLW